MRHGRVDQADTLDDQRRIEETRQQIIRDAKLIDDLALAGERIQRRLEWSLEAARTVDDCLRIQCRAPRRPDTLLAPSRDAPP